MAIKPEWEQYYAKFGHGSKTKGEKCPYMEILKSLYG